MQGDAHIDEMPFEPHLENLSDLPDPGVPIEGAGGPVDDGGQIHTGPPPPPQ